MENSIADSLVKVVKENKVKKEEFSVVKGYYEAIKIYDNLVIDGLAVKRGYNLKSIDSENKIVLFNTML